MSIDVGSFSLLRDLRGRAALTQRVLAERAGVSVRTIRGLERGEVVAPHPSSLVALARGLRLDDQTTDDLIRAYTRERRPPTLNELVDRYIDFERLLAEASIGSEVDLRMVSLSLTVTVGADRLIARKVTSSVVQAVRDGVDRYVKLARGDQGEHPSLNALEAGQGCELVSRLDLPEHRISVFELGLGRALAAGERRSIRFVERRRTERPADAHLARLWHGLRDSDGVVHGPRRRVAQHLVEVTFEGTPPRRLWEIQVPAHGAVERIRSADLDPFGTAHTIAWDLEAGRRYGFEWCW